MYRLQNPTTGYRKPGEECIEPYFWYIEYQEKNAQNPTPGIQNTRRRMYRTLFLVYRIPGEECMEPYYWFIEYQEKNVLNPIPGIEYQEKNVQNPTPGIQNTRRRMYRTLLLVYRIPGEECIELYSWYIEYQEKNVQNPFPDLQNTRRRM